MKKTTVKSENLPTTSNSSVSSSESSSSSDDSESSSSSGSASTESIKDKKIIKGNYPNSTILKRFLIIVNPYKRTVLFLQNAEVKEEVKKWITTLNNKNSNE